METPLERERRAVWEMMYADDAGFVWSSPEGQARMVTIIVGMFAAFGLTLSETETLLMRAPGEKRKQVEPLPLSHPKLVMEATVQTYAQASEFRYLGGHVAESAELTQRAQPTKPARMGLPQEVLPITFRVAVSTVKTQSPPDC